MVTQRPHCGRQSRALYTAAVEPSLAVAADRTRFSLKALQMQIYMRQNSRRDLSWRTGYEIESQCQQGSERAFTRKLVGLMVRRRE